MLDVTCCTKITGKFLLIFGSGNWVCSEDRSRFRGWHWRYH